MSACNTMFDGGYACAEPDGHGGPHVSCGGRVAGPQPGEFSAEMAGHGPFTVDAWRGDDWILHMTTRTRLGAYWKFWRSKRRSR